MQDSRGQNYFFFFIQPNIRGFLRWKDTLQNLSTLNLLITLTLFFQLKHQLFSWECWRQPNVILLDEFTQFSSGFLNYYIWSDSLMIVVDVTSSVYLKVQKT